MSGDINADAEIKALLTELWQRHLPSMHERLKVIDDASLSAVNGRLDEPERAEAQSIAHKLAGNLGMFGYKEAGSIASEIEQILKEPSPESLTLLSGLASKLRNVLQPHL